MSLPLSITLTLGLLAQAKEPTVDPKDDATARLAYMKDSVGPYVVRPREADSAPFRLEPEPIFRLNNAVSGVKDGAIFLWLDDLGRPEAAIQVFKIPSGAWLHEFTSLSTAPFVAKAGRYPTWHPSGPGVEYKPVPDAPRPAPTPEQRLRQMRAMAEDFTAGDDFETKGWNALRLLTKPWSATASPAPRSRTAPSSASSWPPTPRSSSCSRPGPGSRASNGNTRSLR